MVKEELNVWLEELPRLIPIRTIELEVGMPITTLQKVLSGGRPTLPLKWIKPLREYIDKKKGPVTVTITKEDHLNTDFELPELPKEIFKEAVLNRGSEVVLTSEFKRTNMSFPILLKQAKDGVEDAESFKKEVQSAKLTPPQKATILAALNNANK